MPSRRVNQVAAFQRLIRYGDSVRQVTLNLQAWLATDFVGESGASSRIGVATLSRRRATEDAPSQEGECGEKDQRCRIDHGKCDEGV